MLAWFRDSGFDGFANGQRALGHRSGKCLRHLPTCYKFL